MNELFHSIIYIIIWNLFLNLINGKSVTVNSEYELIKNLKNLDNNSVDELIINLNDKTFTFSNDITIENSIEKLYITGESKEKSILKFSNLNNGFKVTNLFRIEQEINFINVTIYGNVQFNNIDNVKFEDVIINGTIDVNKISKNDITITMKKIIYNGLTNSRINCLNLYGNINIDDSKFYGSSLCTNNLLYHNGETLNTVNISNSYFNGMSSNNCIKMIGRVSANINTSTFENCYGLIEGG